MVLDVQPIGLTLATAAARLCNFVTNESKLLKAHEDYLSTTVKAALQQFDSPWVEIFGFASRKGKHARNMALSRQRVEAVGTFIATYDKPVNFQKAWGYGDERSGEDAADNSGYYRAVEVYVYGTKPPPRPDPPSEKVDKQNEFALRFVSGGSLNIGPVQIDGFAFEIGNIARKAAAKFIYGGAGVALSVPIPKLKKIPGSGAATGPWATFSTNRTTPLSTFAAYANIVAEPGMTAGDFSIGNSHLEFLDLKDNDGELRVIGGTIKFSGGPGFALPSGGALTGGKFTLVGKPYGFSMKN